MAIRILNKDEDARYEDFIYANDMGTPFHTMDWMRLTSDSFGFEPLYLIDENPNGLIEGAMPLFEISNLFAGRRIVSLPLRDKGGAVYSTRESAGRLLDYIIDYAKAVKANYVNIKTDDPEEARLLESKSFVRKNEWIVSYIKLSRDFNETKKEFRDARIGWSINKAKRNALRFEEGNGAEDMHNFYSIFLHNRKRLGVPPYSLRFFRNIHDYFIRKGLAKIFFVSKNKTILTSIIVFLMKDRAYDVYSASCDEAYDYRANDFQMYNVIKWLCENGYREYELGADSKYQDTLLKYKQKWGCKRKGLYFYYYFNLARNIEVRDSDHPKYRILRELWRRTPDIVFEKAGSRLIKYLA